MPEFLKFPKPASLDNDAMLAKNACAVAYAYHRKIEAYTHCAQVISAIAVKVLSEVISNQLCKLQAVWIWIVDGNLSALCSAWSGLHTIGSIILYRDRLKGGP